LRSDIAATVTGSAGSRPDEVGDADVVLDGSQLGAGYGRPTDAAAERPDCWRAPKRSRRPVCTARAWPAWSRWLATARSMAAASSSGTPARPACSSRSTPDPDVTTPTDAGGFEVSRFDHWAVVVPFMSGWTSQTKPYVPAVSAGTA
jgi:hypothetical protein